jgi:hypothetical protein
MKARIPARLNIRTKKPDFPGSSGNECYSDPVLKDPDFYLTCATIIPVLFVALAVEKGPYEAVIRAWRKAQSASINFEQTALRASQAMIKVAGEIMAVAEQDAVAATGREASTEPPPQRWEKVRAVGSAIGATVIAPLLSLFAAAIVWAGAFGEGMAVYVLYKGSDSPGDRQLVLIATLFLVGAVTIGPFLAYMRGTLETFISSLRSEARLVQAYFSLLKESASLVESALKQKPKNKETPE